MGKDKGYILLYRELQDNIIWRSEPFTKSQAWIDLLFMASYKDKYIILGNQNIKVQRGSVITSEIKLAEKWKWSRKKVRSFLKLLIELEMIEKLPNNKGTTLFIKNYKKYQEKDTTKGTTENHTNRGIDEYQGTTRDTSKDTTKGTTEGTQLNKDINTLKNKDKDIYIPRHKYGEYKNVLLSDIEVEKLEQEYPEIWRNKLEQLSEYMETHTTHYKSHYATIRSWIRKDNNERSQKDAREDKGKVFNIEDFG